MNQKIKYVFIGFVGLLFIVIGFYFWASSPNLSAVSYNESGQYDHAGKPTNDSVISIISYNIGYLSGMTNNRAVERPPSLFEQNLNKVIYELKKVNPDIIAFQEIDYNSKRSYFVDQQKELSKLGYKYFGRAINWDKKYVPFPYYPFKLHFGKILSGQSVLSKYPIAEQERIALKRNKKNPFYYDSFYIDRLAQVCSIKIGDKTLMLINVHLEAYDEETRKIQMQEVKKIYLKYYRDFPTVLLGDFNSDMYYEDASIQLLINLPDTQCAASDPDQRQNTFDSSSPSLRLDYIFYNQKFIKELDAKIMNQFNQASDHLPIFMKFKFKDQSYASSRRQPTS